MVAVELKAALGADGNGAVPGKQITQVVADQPAAPAGQRADGGLRVLLVDLHTAGLPFYFEGGLRPVHVTAPEGSVTLPVNVP